MDMIALAVNIWSVIVGAVHDGVALLLGAFSWVPGPLEIVQALWPYAAWFIVCAVITAAATIAAERLTR